MKINKTNAPIIAEFIEAYLNKKVCSAGELKDYLPLIKKLAAGKVIDEVSFSLHPSFYQFSPPRKAKKRKPLTAKDLRPGDIFNHAPSFAGQYEVVSVDGGVIKYKETECSRIHSWNLNGSGCLDCPVRIEKNGEWSSYR